MSTPTLQWQDPPAKKMFHPVSPLWDMLEANPNRWAKWPRLVSYAQVGAANKRAKDRGKFEFSIRIEDRIKTCYVRFIPSLIGKDSATCPTCGK